MAQIKALLFDLGKVLVDFDHNIAAKRISQFCRKSPRDIFELFFASEITCDFEAGRIQPFDFFQKIKQSLNLGLSFESFIPIWNEIF
jgi:FMN phosphatase YigB (HAD superfamily)